MGDVINLNRYRKARARADKERHAEANRARHGRTPAENTPARPEQERQPPELDGKRLEPVDDGPRDP
jgi:hypothetical protein